MDVATAHHVLGDVSENVCGMSTGECSSLGRPKMVRVLQASRYTTNRKAPRRNRIDKHLNDWEEERENHLEGLHNSIITLHDRTISTLLMLQKSARSL